MKPFLDALDERVLVCDGAMGTMLYAKGVFISKSFDALNLTNADLVEAVHQEYVSAGADIIETNTFGANRIKLGSFGLAEKLGLKAETLFAIASKSTSQCWAMTSYCPVPGPVPTSPANRGYAPGFTGAMMLKDLKLAQQAAIAAGATTPLGAEAAALLGN